MTLRKKPAWIHLHIQVTPENDNAMQDALAVTRTLDPPITTQSAFIRAAIERLAAEVREVYPQGGNPPCRV